MRTRKEQNQARFEHMKKILETLRTKKEPRLVEELHSDAFGSSKSKFSRRSLFNYLEELEALGLIVHEEGKYRATELKIIRFDTKEDLKLALDHSKILLHNYPCSKEFSRDPITCMADLKVDVVEGREHLITPPPVSEYIHLGYDLALDSHLKTGYYEEIWLPVQKIRQFITKHPELGYGQFGIIGTPGLEESDDRPPDDKPLHDDQPVLIREWRAPKLSKEVIEDLREVERLDAEIAGRLLEIMAKIENSIPLKGSCDLCPKSSISVGRGLTRE